MDLRAVVEVAEAGEEATMEVSKEQVMFSLILWSSANLVNIFNIQNLEKL